jgi:hypothetical protein
MNPLEHFCLFVTVSDDMDVCHRCKGAKDEYLVGRHKYLIIMVWGTSSVISNASNYCLSATSWRLSLNFAANRP